MPEIKNLTDKNGNIIYPRTNGDAVVINENLLTDILKNKVSKNELTFNVKDFGAKGDGVTDDSDAIKNCLDYIKIINDNTTLVTNCVKIIFPYGIYAIEKPIIMETNAIIDFNNSQIIATAEMDYMWSFNSSIQLPGIILNDMVLHGKGIAKKGLWIKDVSMLIINRIRTFSFIEHHIYADKTGSSGQTHFCINAGELLGGINSNAGGYESTVDAIGLEIRTTDCMIRDLTTRDFKIHIYNTHGINFYDHCHAWNQYSQIMAGSCHFKVGWDIDCIGCYTDTIQKAFIFNGDARGNITNHQIFNNRDFYNAENFGSVYVYEITSAEKGNLVNFINCRFDYNSIESAISPNDNYVNFIKFYNCINNGFTSGKHITTEFKEISKDLVSVSSNVTNLWGWQGTKRDNNQFSMMAQGDISIDTFNNGGKINLFNLPEDTYNLYQLYPIFIGIGEYNTNNNQVFVGEITTTGEVNVFIANQLFIPTNNCHFSINTSYHIKY